MSVPLIILILTGILAIVVLPFRSRLRLTASIASAGALMIGGFTLLATLEEPFVLLGVSLKWSGTWHLLGRSMTLDQGNRAAVAFMYLVGSLIFGGVWIARPNRTFIFVGIISIGVVAASFMIQPFLFAAIFLEITAMGAVLILSSRESFSIRDRPAARALHLRNGCHPHCGLDSRKPGRYAGNAGTGY